MLTLRSPNVKEIEMKRKRYSEEQIIQVMKEVDEGMSVPDAARKHGVAAASIYPGAPVYWKSERISEHVPYGRYSDAHLHQRSVLH